MESSVVLARGIAASLVTTGSSSHAGRGASKRVLLTKSEGQG